MGWLRKAAARVLLRTSGALMNAGLKLVEALPDEPEPEERLDEDDEADEPVPLQQPITEDTMAIMDRKPRWRAGETKPAEKPPLQGSAQERYASHPRRNSRRHRR